MKFCFPFEGKRAFEHCSLGGMDSEIGGEQVVEVASSFISEKQKKRRKYVSYSDSVIKSNYMSLAYNS